MVRRLAARAIASPIVQAAALAAGGFFLVAMWQGFNQFAFNRSRGVTTWSWEVMAWYALPGFEAGVLVGLLPWAASRGWGRLLAALNRAVWAADAVNVAIVWFLISRGGLF